MYIKVEVFNKTIKELYFNINIVRIKKKHKSNKSYFLHKCFKKFKRYFLLRFGFANLIHNFSG